MNIGSRRIGPAIRMALARRPWIRWVAIAAMAVTAGWVVHTQMRGIDDARAEWSDRRVVLVAASDLAPGDELLTRVRSLPEAAIPASAVELVPDGALSRQHVDAGEVITRADVGTGTGPAATADAGLVVVAVSDPLLTGAMSTVEVGLTVQIHSDGLVLADVATITALDGEVVFVALEPRDAPSVSAAAQDRRASIAFVP